MNSKEALKQYKEIYVDKTFKGNACPSQEWYLEIIEQDLDRLEKLENENASLHTEIESLQSENEILKKSIENSNKSYDILMQNSNIQFLNQNQEIFKLKKVIEMLKNKLDIEIYEIHENGVTEYYLDCSAGEVIDEQKEYELLKEWFGNEK